MESLHQFEKAISMPIVRDRLSRKHQKLDASFLECSKS